MKTIVLVVCLAGFLPLAVGQAKAPKRITAAEAKDHVGETATVCGKAVDTRTGKYVLSGHGKPVQVDLDQPEPNPIFYFVTFGPDTHKAQDVAPGPDTHKPQDVAPTYLGKQVCVTGTLSVATGAPFIMVSESSQIKIQADEKK